MKTAIIVVLMAALGCVDLATAATVEQGQQAYRAADYARAHDIFLPLAQQGNSTAQIALGLLYERGQGVDKNVETAVSWYVKAAQQDLPMVQHDLAVKFYNGDGIPQDYAQAAKWWRRAAEGGVADAAYNLGLMYSRGLGFEQNNALAVNWFLQAAEAGHPRAQYSLAVMYAFGDGMQEDFARAAHWFEQSAQQGVAEAQYNLGLLYERGRGVPIDMHEAVAWYSKAADQGIAPARARLQIIARGASSVDAASGLQWVKAQDPARFTLQLTSVSSKAAIEKFLASLPAGGPPSAYMRYEANGMTRFAALYGSYATREAAELARDQLPAALKKHQPWIRKLSELQQIALPL